MTIIGADGQYEVISGTKTLKTSNHPIYQAQIELNLRRGKWIGASNSGHSLSVRDKQSNDKINEYKKELRFYLNKYDPDIRDEAIQRSNVIFPIVIAEDAFNE